MSTDQPIGPPERLMTTNTELEARDQKLFGELSAYVNHLIQTDFNYLVHLLYRIDVSEKKLKEYLKSKPDEDAGNLIAQMMIERQVEKIRTRNSI